MSLSTSYLLIAPIGMAFLAVALLAAWSFDRRHLYLRTMALGILLTSVALGIQSLLGQARVQYYATYTGVLYLGGAWLAGLCIAQKFSLRYPHKTGFALACIALLGLYHFSIQQPNFPVRVLILSLALGSLQLLALRNLFQRKQFANRIDRSIYWLFLGISVYTLVRPLLIATLTPASQFDVGGSIYWFITLLGSTLISMAIPFLLLASSIHKHLQALRHERDLDPLTSLLNRRALHEAQPLQQRTSALAPTTLLMCDIDFFKQINDRWGHAYGDQVLRDVAHCLRQSTRAHDLVVRYGGEEFLLLLPETSLDEARTIAQRIQSRLQTMPASHAQRPAVTLSFGITQMAPHEPLTDAIARADVQLYKAKATGRDRMCVG